MKRLVIIYFIVLKFSWSFCQVPDSIIDFQNFPELTGQQFKLIEPGMLNFPRYYIGLKFGANIPQQPGNYAFGESLTDSIVKQIYTMPVLHKKLIQAFGGEFFIGESGINGDIQNSEMHPAFQIGLFIGTCLAQNVVIDIGYFFRQHDISGTLPMTIYTEGNSESMLATADLSSRITFNTIELRSSYILSNLPVNPYAGFGLFWQWQNQSGTDVIFQNITFDLPNSSRSSSYAGISFHAGAVVDLIRRYGFFIEIEYLKGFNGKEEEVKGSGIDVSAGFLWRWG